MKLSSSHEANRPVTANTASIGERDNRDSRSFFSHPPSRTDLGSTSANVSSGMMKKDESLQEEWTSGSRIAILRLHSYHSARKSTARRDRRLETTAGRTSWELPDD